MNKIGMVFGIAVVATLAGCKDPDYNRTTGNAPQNEVKTVDAPPPPPPSTTTPVQNDSPVVGQQAKCQCPPGTKHTTPCACGAADCTCVITSKQVLTADVSQPAEPAYTVYVVQSGDYLAKISKRYNVTINSIKRLNPSIKNDVIKVGQKLKLPGKIDVGVQEAPKKASESVVATTKKASAAYAGATKDYVVKNGDTLGAIAYGNGITIRQLKALNGLTGDSLKIGQTLKIPAEKVAKKAVDEKKPAAAKKSVAKAEKKVEKKAEKKEPAEAAAAATAVETPVAETPVAEQTSGAAAPVEAGAEAATPAETPAAPQVDAGAAPAPAAAEKADGKPAEAPATITYVVQEGDDITGVSIQWGVSAADIRQLNNMAEGDKLTAGQIIKLPADAQR